MMVLVFDNVLCKENGHAELAGHISSVQNNKSWDHGGPDNRPLCYVDIPS